MGFESVRGYVELASGLSDLTRARAMEVARGLLSLPATGVATGTKMASQASALADELLAAAAANRSMLTTLVRTEVDFAITSLGLVPIQRLEEAQAETARLRAEVARLSPASPKKAAPKRTTKKAAAPRRTANKAAVPKRTAKKAVAKTATTADKVSTAGRSAVATRAKPAGT